MTILANFRSIPFHAMPSLPRPKPCRCAEAVPLSIQSLYVVGLELSLRTRLASYTHARRICRAVEMHIASPAFDSANNLTGKFPNSTLKMPKGRLVSL